MYKFITDMGTTPVQAFNEPGAHLITLPRYAVWKYDSVGTPRVIETGGNLAVLQDRHGVPISRVRKLAVKRDFSQKERDKLAETGAAMEGGGYPIKTTADLHNAIQAFGRAKNKAATKQHIITRARALGATDSLPDGWVSKSLAGGTAADYIHDFVASGDKRFKGDDKKQRIRRALGAFYGKRLTEPKKESSVHQFAFHKVNPNHDEHTGQFTSGEGGGGGLRMKASASTYDKATGKWDIQEREYKYNGSNRKAAIAHGLRRIQSEFPNHKQHEVAIKD